jgi:2'-5' RNA ligase
MWYRFAKKGGHSSVMVAFYLPKGVAKKLAVGDGDVPGELGINLEAPEDMHLTLVMLGQADDLEHKSDLIQACLKSFAEKCAPVEGTIGGIGTFTPDGTAGDTSASHPVYYSFDGPELPDFRQRLVEALSLVGVDIDATHGYTPHITIGYTKDGTKGNEVLPHVEFAPAKVKFDKIALRWADENRGDFQLAG